MTEWTAARLEALPEGTVIETYGQEFWLCPDGWLDGDRVEPATDGRVSVTGGIDASTRAPDAAALLLPGGMELDVVRGAA